VAKYIATFCNAGSAKLAVIDGTQISRVIDLDPARLHSPAQGLIGITLYKGRIIVATQSTPCSLLVLGPHLAIEAVIPVPEIKDIHGLAARGDVLLIASAGTNQIVEFNLETRVAKPFWFYGGSLSDTVHVNDIAVAGERLYCTIFGPRLPNDLRGGQIIDVVATRLFVRAYGNRIASWHSRDRCMSLNRQPGT